MSKEKFNELIHEGYNIEGKSLILGGAMYENECQTHNHIKIPLKTLNRHGLIAGATGTGKTKTLQVLSEQLSASGVPTLIMDVKGDLSGIAAAGKTHPKIEERHDKIGLPFQPAANPAELLSLSEEKGARLRATVLEFGPVLFSKILDLNETQSGIISVAFKYCDDNELPLLDLKDIKKVLQYMIGEGKDELEKDYGSISKASIGTITRKILELEQQGADKFFGEKSFEVEDLLATDHNGKGKVNILRLTDIQGKPKLFSTFMLQMLAEIYATFPEEGDMEKPKLVLFIDEAHLIFEEATDALMDQLEVIIKLIRSKGVGIIFVTQNPNDLPEVILGQLGLKIQHALRAFTAKDRKAIKLVAQNFPESEFYDIAELITNMGIGEALVTALSDRGTPTPLVHTYLRAPNSRMDVLTGEELDDLVNNSELVKKYNEDIDRESAYEILSGKLEEYKEEETQERLKKQTKKAVAEKSTLDKVMGSTATKQIGRTVARELTRGLLGVLGVKTTSRRSSRKSSWF
jgi:DNA helicase HerA-like ATPase